MKVYPNPFQNELTIEGIQNLGSYRLMTLEGELVKEGFLSDKKNTISMSDLKNGVYFLRISDKVHKVIKMN